jgi:hypothetical protein
MVQQIPDIVRHFENVKAGLIIGLQRGIFNDFETATAIKQSLDALNLFIRHAIEPIPKERVESNTTNHLSHST